MHKYARYFRLYHYTRDKHAWDAFDLKLLNALQEDGRLTNLELASGSLVRLAVFAPSHGAGAIRVIEGYHAALANQAVVLMCWFRSGQLGDAIPGQWASLCEADPRT